MFSIPIFSIETYTDPSVSFDIGLGYVQIYGNSSRDLNFDAMSIFLDYHRDLRTPIVYMEFYNNTKTCCNIYPS